MNPMIPHKTHRADVCVIGGGMSGLCAAVAAARHGAKVVLMHDRPVLGGNASSEIRMWIRGARERENRETGIIQEIELENIYRNPTMNYSIWDTVLYEQILKEPNITYLANCSCLDCWMEHGRIESVTGWQLNTYSFHTVAAELFLDCSGDSILAPLTGAAYRHGREDQREFEEYGACLVADRHTMGSSLLIEARETDRKCTFIPPEWAYVYPDDESMYLKNHDIPGTGVNFWWIELGGMADTIADAQDINHELIKTAYGIWDHIKNRGDHGMDNWELEWIGFLPGKRESRRYEGAYILNQRDLEEGSHFADTVAFGGWTMDNHSPLGFQYNGYSSRHIDVKSPYEIPFRCLYSRNVPNLMFAGRNISASHMAMSSTRVMATCALLGQAAGTGAALATRYGCLPAEIGKSHIRQLQKLLMDDGCFLPGVIRQVSDAAVVDHPHAEVLRDGWERPYHGQTHCIRVRDLRVQVRRGGVLRLALDPDFSRESISPVSHYRKFAMRTHIPGQLQCDRPVNMPKDLLRSATVRFRLHDGTEQTVAIRENRKVRIFLRIPEKCAMIELSGMESWSGGGVNLFACDILEN